MNLFLADLILVMHVAFVAFVVLGLLLVLVGIPLKWHWIRSPWFRGAHLLGIGFVVVQAWFGRISLTIWENNLRQSAGGEGYAGSFIQHWFQEILFYDAEPWVFTLGYTAFGALVIITWAIRPPRLRKARPA